VHAVAVRSGWSVGVLIALFKLRVVALLVLASLGGALLAAEGLPAGHALILLLMTGVLASAGASALNQVIEREQDARMQRTWRRPLATGAVNPRSVWWMGSGLIALAIAIAWPFNRWLAVFLALGAFIYVGVYTVWLKPRTPLNIVIGGAAGSCAVLSGSAAVGNWAHPTAIGLALLVFVWTPIHFWSLAHAYREDYVSVGVPMLPAVVSPRATARWIALHVAATVVVALALSMDPTLGWRYLALVVPASGWLVWQAVQLLARPTAAQALWLFKYSNLYLGLNLLAIYLGTL